MEPKKLIETLIAQAKTGEKGRDIKFVQNEDGTSSLLFGNHGMQKAFTFYPKGYLDTANDEQKAAFKNRDLSANVYDDNNPSFRELNYKEEDYDSQKQVMLDMLDSGFEIAQNPDIMPDKLASLRKQYNIEIPGVPNNIPGQPSKGQSINKEVKSNFGSFDPTFDLSTPAMMSQTAATFGKLGVNMVSKGGTSLVEGLYSTGYDVVKGGKSGVTKQLKDMSGGILGLATPIVAAQKAATQTLYDYFNGGEGGIDKFMENYDSWNDVLTSGVENIDALKYNLQEQKLAEEKYNDHYLKATEDFKTKNSYAIEPPKGEASWTNPEWLEYQAFNAIESAGAFSIPMVLGSGLSKVGTAALAKGVGRTLGPGLEKAALKVAKTKSISALKDAPQGFRDYVAAPIARTSAALQDMQQMTAKGEAIGVTGAGILNTKFEADLEGFQVYNDMLQESQSKFTQQLLESGMQEEEVRKQLEQHDWTEEKNKARLAAEQVTRANAAILGLSNFGTIKLLGLGPKSVAARTYGQMAKDGLEKAAPVTAMLMKPWSKRLVRGSLELGKEGGEETYQGSIADYEKNKGYEKEGFIDSMVGATKDIIANYNNPEKQAEFFSGMVGSMVTQGALSGYRAVADNITKGKMDNVSKNAFSMDVNQYINSVIEPLRDGNYNLRDKPVQAHFIRAASILNNEVAKDAANYTGDWQLEHVLEQEGFNKLYYEARQNGISHSDATQYILGALKARPEEKMYLPAHKTPYTDYKDKTTFMAEVEQGLSRAGVVYDNLDKLVKHYAKKNIELTPEKRQRLFEAISNHREFQTLNQMLTKNISKDEFLNGREIENLTPSEALLFNQINVNATAGITPKVDKAIQQEATKDAKLNQIYQVAYTKVIDDLLDDKSLKEDSLQHKANKVEEVSEEDNIPLEDAAAQIASNPQEANKILNHIEQSNERKANSNFTEKTKVFQKQMDLLFTAGMNDFGDNISEISLNNLIDQYLESVSEDVRTLGKDRNDVNKVVQNVLARNATAYRGRAGSLDMATERIKLKERYKEGNGQRSALFALERADLSAKLLKEGFKDEATYVHNATDAVGIMEAYEEASPEAKNIIRNYYDYGNTKQGAPVQPVMEMTIQPAEYENNETDDSYSIDLVESTLDAENLTEEEMNSLINCNFR